MLSFHADLNQSSISSKLDIVVEVFILNTQDVEPGKTHFQNDAGEMVQDMLSDLLCKFEERNSYFLSPHQRGEGLYWSPKITSLEGRSRKPLRQAGHWST